MGLATFMSIFNGDFLALKEKRLSVYGWEHYFRDIVEKKLKIPRVNRDSLSKPIEVAYFNNTEGTTERDKFEAIMLCILDLAVASNAPGEWNKSAIQSFMSKMYLSHFDAYLLYLEIRKNQSNA